MQVGWFVKLRDCLKGAGGIEVEEVEWYRDSGCAAQPPFFFAKVG